MSRTDLPAARRLARQSGPSARSTSFLQGRQAVNIMRTVTSTLGSFRRLAALGVSLALAACGSSQNWHDEQPDTSRSAAPSSGFTGGTLALWNNGSDKLAIAANGSFTFPLQIANGSDYAVVVATQPAGQTCTVTNGTGTAQRQRHERGRDLRALHLHAAAAAGDLQHGQGRQLQPVSDRRGTQRRSRCPATPRSCRTSRCCTPAGFNLLRLFGAEPPATDVVAEKILRLAAQNYPGHEVPARGRPRAASPRAAIRRTTTTSPT